MAVKNIIRYAAAILLAGSVIGLGLGIGNVLYSTRKDDSVAKAKHQYEEKYSKLDADFKVKLDEERKGIDGQLKLLTEKEKNLEKAFQEKEEALKKEFYGGLESLTSTDDVISLTPLERNLYFSTTVQDILNLNNLREDDKFLDETVNNIHILGYLPQTVIYNKDGKIDEIKKNVVVLKKEKKDGSILSANYYDVEIDQNFIAKLLVSSPKSVSRTPENVAQSLTIAKPRLTFTFREDEAIYVDHSKSELTRMKEGKVLYRGGNVEMLEINRRYATNILHDFTVLYNRGPFANQSELINTNKPLPGVNQEVKQ